MWLNCKRVVFNSPMIGILGVRLRSYVAQSRANFMTAGGILFAASRDQISSALIEA